MTDPTPPPPPIRPPAPLIVLRCPTCANRLADIRLTPGSCVTIKCSKCNTMVQRVLAA
ncbi:MAG: hypothetical protein M3440_08215 [Chloroflexota bacterium]|nr:hypothetical protein [Chloroflexota bacterium]